MPDPWSLQKIAELRTEIHGKLNELRQEIQTEREERLSALAEVLAAITTLNEEIDVVTTEVNDLIGKLPTDGGLSATEVEEVKTALQGVSDKLTAIPAEPA